MALPSCPSCEIKLTKSEGNKTACPVCGGKLPARKAATVVSFFEEAPRNQTNREKSSNPRPGKWLVAGLVAACGLSGAFVEAIATGLKSSGLTGVTVGVVLGVCFAQGIANWRQSRMQAQRQ